MSRVIVFLVSVCLVSGLSGCGEQPKEAIDCRMKIKLSGGLDGTYRYGAWVSSKGCSGTGTGDRFDIGLSQDDLPDVSIVVCGIGPGEVGDGLASLQIYADTGTWSSGDDWYDCEQGACPVTVTVNEFRREEDAGFPGAEYWVEGTGYCDQPLEGPAGSGLEPTEVVGEFTFGGMPGLWE